MTAHQLPARAPSAAGVPPLPGPDLPARGRRCDLVALVLLGVLAAVVSVWNLSGATAVVDDEGTYTAQAFSVLEGRLAPYTYRYDHPPLGWIQLGVLAWIPELLGLGGGSAVGAARYAVAPFFVATALLVFLIARRLGVHRGFAALSVVVLVLSPLSLTYGRQVFLDNIGVPWLLLAFWMAMSPRAALWHHIWAGVFFAVAVLSKETLAVFGPALLVALLNRPSWSNRAFSVMGFVVVGGLVLGFYPLMAVLSGELIAGPGRVSLQDGLVYQFFSRPGSGALWDSGSDRAELVRAWLFHDRYLLGAGLVAGTACLLRRRTAWIAAAIGTAALPVVLGAGYLPGMYVVGVLPFLALAVGAALAAAWDGLEEHLATRTTSLRPWLRGAGVASVAVGLLLTLTPERVQQGRNLLTREANADHAAVLSWVREEVPHEDTVLVPFALWPDLAEEHVEDPWSVVPTEKMDLDPEFVAEHPDGREDVEWIVVGPYTRDTIEELELVMAGAVLERSEPVHSVGGWSVHRVHGG